MTEVKGYNLLFLHTFLQPECLALVEMLISINLNWTYKMLPFTGSRFNFCHCFTQLVF